MSFRLGVFLAVLEQIKTVSLEQMIVSGSVFMTRMQKPTLESSVSISHHTVECAVINSINSLMKKILTARTI